MKPIALIRCILPALFLALALSSCINRAELGGKPYQSPRQHNRQLGEVKDSKPSLWLSDHARVRKLRQRYRQTRTVPEALRRGRRFLPTIVREFEKRKLPTQLAYLPMLESLFQNRADSGSAKGMWQFTPQTAKEMNLRVGFMVDERLNWRKATIAAARYLDRLGARFNYDWALALAAYNGGPNYLQKHIAAQRTSNFWKLNLRRETAEYVPRFVAMLQVAQEKFSHMMVAGR